MRFSDHSAIIRTVFVSSSRMGCAAGAVHAVTAAGKSVALQQSTRLRRAMLRICIARATG
jgi:hypothetical protein